jgi:hypothetical protein
MLQPAQTEEVVAFVDVPASDAFMTGADFGPEIALLSFDDGCVRETPPNLGFSHPLILCLRLAVENVASLGKRRVAISFESGGETFTAHGNFWVGR